MDLDSVCKEIRAADGHIMSLTVADTRGNLLAHSYGSEYQQKYLEAAAEVRGKASILASLIVGMEQQFEEIFGKTEAVCRIHQNALLIVIPCPSGTKILTLLTKHDVIVPELLPKIRPIIRDL